MITGLGAMVWKLREWKNGDPIAQANEAVRLGLAWVSIKVNDGFRRQWESDPRNNKALLPEAVEALKAAGVDVAFWGWGWGDRKLWDYEATIPFYKSNTAQLEARVAVGICREFGVTHYQFNAEHPYRGSYVGADKARDMAERWCKEANDVGPDIEFSLCGNRFPLTSWTDFPSDVFAPQVDAWCPQVYWLQDNRDDGGTIQLATSDGQYDQIRELPFFGIGPTYQHTYVGADGKTYTWRATKSQLLKFFDKAKELGHVGVGVWDLEQASDQQLAALEEYEWNPVPPPQPPDSDLPARLRAVAVRVREQAHLDAGELEMIATALEQND